MCLPCLVDSFLFRAIKGTKLDDRVGQYVKRSCNAMSIHEVGTPSLREAACDEGTPKYLARCRLGGGTIAASLWSRATAPVTLHYLSFAKTW